MAKYKPGQLITINHKVYQVKDGTNDKWCKNCAFYHLDNCNESFPDCTMKIGSCSYLKLIVPKK